MREADLISLCVRWYLRYLTRLSKSRRDDALNVACFDHTTMHCCPALYIWIGEAMSTVSESHQWLMARRWVIGEKGMDVSVSRPGFKRKHSRISAQLHQWCQSGEVFVLEHARCTSSLHSSSSLRSKRQLERCKGMKELSLERFSSFSICSEWLSQHIHRIGSPTGCVLWQFFCHTARKPSSLLQCRYSVWKNRYM